MRAAIRKEGRKDDAEISRATAVADSSSGSVVTGLSLSLLSFFLS
jgi:hypothetical protein